MSRHWLWWRLLQIGFDLVMLWVLAMLAYFVRVGWVFSTDFPFAFFAILSLLSSVVWLLVLMMTKYYRVIPSHQWDEQIAQVIKILLGGCLAVGFLIVSYFFPRDVLFSRLIGVYVFLFGSVYLLVSDWAYRAIIAWQKKHRPHLMYRTLIVGANRVAEQIITRLNADPYAPHLIVGVIDPYGLAAPSMKSFVLGKLNKLESVCAKEKIDYMLQCDGFEHTLNLITFCEQEDIKFEYATALRGVVETNLKLRNRAGLAMQSFVQRNYHGAKKKWYQVIDWVMDRVFDV
jgi:FlaA1/EpsC-like NDP-sugar epimerase